MGLCRIPLIGGGNYDRTGSNTKNIEEFVQLQNYMLLVDKGAEAYKVMKIRYSAPKVILTLSAVKLTDIDRIKE